MKDEGNLKVPEDFFESQQNSQLNLLKAQSPPILPCDEKQQNHDLRESLSQTDCQENTSRNSEAEFVDDCKTLDLSSRNLSNISEDFNEKVTNLILTGNKFVFLLNIKGEFIRNIRNLSMKKNRLISLKGIQEWTRIEHLDISENYLSDDQMNELVGLEYLKSIDLSRNHLKSQNIINRIIHCSSTHHLETLNLSNNNLTEISIESDSCDIDTLKLNGNNLIRFHIFTSTRINIVNLDLSNNKLTSFSTENLECLVILIIDNNLLTSLEIHRSDSLKQISCRNNQIEKIEISKQNTQPFENLEIFLASNNHIKSIEFLKSAKSLKEMDVSSNIIDDLKDFFEIASQFSHLIKFNYKSNPFLLKSTPHTSGSAIIPLPLRIIPDATEKQTRSAKQNQFLHLLLSKTPQRIPIKSEDYVTNEKSNSSSKTGNENKNKSPEQPQKQSVFSSELPSKSPKEPLRIQTNFSLPPLSSISPIIPKNPLEIWKCVNTPQPSTKSISPNRFGISQNISNPKSPGITPLPSYSTTTRTIDPFEQAADSPFSDPASLIAFRFHSNNINSNHSLIESANIMNGYDHTKALSLPRSQPKLPPSQVDISNTLPQRAVSQLSPYHNPDNHKRTQSAIQNRLTSSSLSNISVDEHDIPKQSQSKPPRSEFKQYAKVPAQVSEKSLPQWIYSAPPTVVAASLAKALVDPYRTDTQLTIDATETIDHQTRSHSNKLENQLDQQSFSLLADELYTIFKEFVVEDASQIKARRVDKRYLKLIIREYLANSKLNSEASAIDRILAYMPHDLPSMLSFPELHQSLAAAISSAQTATNEEKSNNDLKSKWLDGITKPNQSKKEPNYISDTSNHSINYSNLSFKADVQNKQKQRSASPLLKTPQYRQKELQDIQQKLQFDQMTEATRNSIQKQQVNQQANSNQKVSSTGIINPSIVTFRTIEKQLYEGPARFMNMMNNHHHRMDTSSISNQQDRSVISGIQEKPSVKATLERKSSFAEGNSFLSAMNTIIPHSIDDEAQQNYNFGSNFQPSFLNSGNQSPKFSSSQDIVNEQKNLYKSVHSHVNFILREQQKRCRISKQQQQQSTKIIQLLESDREYIAISTILKSMYVNVTRIARSSQKQLNTIPSQKCLEQLNNDSRNYSTLNQGELSDLGQIIESDFSSVYAHMPQTFAFNLSQANSFAKSYFENKSRSKSIVGAMTQPNANKWRVILALVSLGKCFIQHSNSLTSLSHVNLSDLKREGYSSVYLENKDAYILLDNLLATPLYLCEYFSL